jgi:XisH protein
LTMPVIRIPDELYERLQKHASPFVDTPATVIERLLNAYETNQSGTVAKTRSHESTSPKSKSEGNTFGGFQQPSIMTHKVEGVTVTPTSHGQVRVSGKYKLVQLIKWATVQGYDRADTVKVCDLLLGVPPQASTLGCHRSAGLALREGKTPTHHNGPVAKVSTEDAKRVISEIGKPTEQWRRVAAALAIDPQPGSDDLIARLEFWGRPLSAKNIHHDAMIDALKADGWTITADPLTLQVGERDLYIDLAAERAIIGAEKGSERIAVEVQSFLNPSAVRNLEEALGQYLLYRVILARQQPDRPLFLGVSGEVYDGILSEPLGQIVLTDLNIRVLVFDPATRKVLRWIS